MFSLPISCLPAGTRLRYFTGLADVAVNRPEGSFSGIDFAEGDGFIKIR